MLYCGSCSWEPRTSVPELLWFRCEDKLSISKTINGSYALLSHMPDLIRVFTSAPAFIPEDTEHSHYHLVPFRIFRIEFAIFTGWQLLAVLIFIELSLEIKRTQRCLLKVKNLSHLPNTLNHLVQTVSKTMCGTCAFLGLCICVLWLQASVTSNGCAHTCLFFMHVLHAFMYMNISLFLVPMLEYILLIALECDFTWCAVHACKTDSVLKWTLDLLVTRWRQASCLPEPSYNDWDNRSCLLTPMCSFETRKKRSQTDNFFCVLWRTSGSRIASSGSISCLLFGGELEP